MQGGAGEPPPPPTAGSVAERVSGVALELHRSLPWQDTTYVSNQRHFFMWVDAKRRENILPPGNKHITRENVDLYFTEYVARRKEIKPETARRYVSSLQRHADRVEYAGSSERFIVDKNRVHEALELQSRAHFEHVKVQVRDPHTNLPTSMLSEAEKVRAMRHVLSTRAANWKEMCFSWTACEHMMLRMASLLTFKLNHLLTDLTHGPEDGDNDRSMLCIIYEQHEHKEKQTRKRVVGAWRHRDWLQCCVGHLAMSLFVCLRRDTSLNFYKGATKTTKPSWWNVPLIAGWHTMAAAKSAYDSLLTKLKLTWEKCTHLRKAGTEYASSVGELVPHEIATMSKHTFGDGQKLTSVYITELFPPTLRVMAGFKKDGGYFVPRTKIDISQVCGNQEAVDIVFPRYRLWVQQRESENGDKTAGAYNFLYFTLPFLAKVVIQDGCYWIKEFPEHEASIALLSAMLPAYAGFAKQSRDWVKNQLLSVQQVNMAVMNGATQETFHLMRAELVEMRAEFRRSAQEQNATIAALSAALMEANNIRANQDEDRRIAPAPPQAPTAQVAIAPRRAPPPRPAPARALPALNRAFQQNRLNMGAQLRNNPLVPDLATKLPDHLRVIVAEFQDQPLRLEQYKEISKSHWPRALQIAYSKRLYLFKQIMAKAREIPGSNDFRTMKMPQAADLLEEECGNRSMDQLLRKLKATDPNKKERVKD